VIDLVAERSRLGGLERWLDDPLVNDVVVHRGHVWVDRGGGLAHVADMSTEATHAAIEHILRPIGRRLDRTTPSVDARLPDGSRVCAVIPPVAVDGVGLALRRFSSHQLTFADFGDAPVIGLLQQCIGARCNVLVSGATSAGKTSLLGAMVAQVPHHERVVALEDVSEMPVHHPHVVRLEARPATSDGTPAVLLDDLLRMALRLRPDRLVVGEVRGVEAEHLVQAMNTGHDGSMATVHANSAVDALDRLATLVSCASPSWPAHAITQHIARAVDVVVHVERTPRGRRVVEVVEVVIPKPGQHRQVRPLWHHGELDGDVGRRRR
jgi:pilus assembly protein CpaF